MEASDFIEALSGAGKQLDEAGDINTDQLEYLLSRADQIDVESLNDLKQAMVRLAEARLATQLAMRDVLVGIASANLTAQSAMTMAVLLLERNVTAALRDLKQ